MRSEWEMEPWEVGEGALALEKLPMAAVGARKVMRGSSGCPGQDQVGLWVEVRAVGVSQEFGSRVCRSC